MMKNDINFNIINPQANAIPTIVFLHEGLGCTKTWKNYPQLICDRLGMRGIVYDRAGYGESDGDLTNRTNDYLIEAADELESILMSQKLKSTILYGHSDGGSIALAFAAKYPKKVVCLISEAAHVINETETISGIEEAVIAFKQGKLEGLKKWHKNNYKQVFNAWSNTWLRKEFNLITLKNLLPKIEANQLIIQGTNDQYGTISQVKTIDKLTKGKTTILMPNCGHAPFLEAQDEVLTAAIEFIKSQINGNS